MVIKTNTVYQSSTNRKVMPYSVRGDNVYCYVGQPFGSNMLFTENRCMILTREEFEHDYHPQNDNGEGQENDC